MLPGAFLQAEVGVHPFGPGASALPWFELHGELLTFAGVKDMGLSKLGLYKSGGQGDARVPKGAMCLTRKAVGFVIVALFEF